MKYDGPPAAISRPTSSIASAAVSGANGTPQTHVGPGPAFGRATAADDAATPASSFNCIMGRLPWPIAGGPRLPHRNRILGCERARGVASQGKPTPAARRDGGRDAYRLDLARARP